MALRTKFLGTTALLGSGTYLSYRSRNPTLLDSPSSSSSSSTSTPSVVPSTHPVSASLSAYDTKENPVYLIPEPPTALQSRITQLRLHLSHFITQSDAAVRSLVDHAIMGEQKVERTIKSLKPRNETVLPGALYVAIAGLSGSIVSRNRSFPIRFLTPVLFFWVAGRVFIPETSSNVGNLIYSWESKVPELKKLHDATREKVVGGIYKAGEVVEDAEHLIDGAVQGSREAFEKSSGIKLPK